MIKDHLPWEDDDDDYDDHEKERTSHLQNEIHIRDLKKKSVLKEKELKEKITELEGECRANPDDDSTLVILILSDLIKLVKYI